MLQKECQINYIDIRTNKSEVGELFIIHSDKRRMDDVPRLQPIEVEVEAEAVEVEENFDADKCINTSVSIFMLFSFLAVIFGCFYLHPIASTVVTVATGISALFINRAVRLHDIRVAKKQRD